MDLHVHKLSNGACTSHCHKPLVNFQDFRKNGARKMSKICGTLTSYFRKKSLQGNFFLSLFRLKFVIENQRLSSACWREENIQDKPRVFLHVQTNLSYGPGIKKSKSILIGGKFSQGIYSTVENNLERH